MECKVIHNVVAPAAEAEMGGLFYNYQQDLTVCMALTEMGHPQRPTPMKTDNATALPW